MHDNLARQLWQARIDGTVIDATSIQIPDQDTAYKIQHAVSEIAESEIVGFKIGATTQAAIDALGLSESMQGPLFERFCHSSGDEVPASSQHKVLLETEVAIGLGQALPTREAAYQESDVRDAVAWIAPGFELVTTRFDIELAGHGNFLIADGGVNMDFVLGEKITDWSHIDLSQNPATLTINGQDTASGHSGMTLFGNPLATVAWLANHFSLQSRGLRAGDVITTGTCTGMTPVVANDEARADLGPMGTISMKLVES